MGSLETYLLAAFAPMIAAFTLLLVCTDLQMKWDEWSAKSLMNWTVGIVILLTIAALAATFLTLNAVPDLPVYAGTHLKSWAVNFADLGYMEAEFLDRRANGFIWFVITAMAYLLFVVGGSLIAAIRNNQIAPHHNQREQASSN